MTNEANPEQPARRLQIGMLLYPRHTMLDLVGPHMALDFLADVHLVWKQRDEPIVTEQGVSVFPTMTFDECPEELDVLFVPGGDGMTGVIDDLEVMRFIADRGARARYVTSVCTGAVILAAAGLLDGYRAATHWGARGLLARIGVGEVVVGERVVIDGNRITGGGVTAGIDFALTLVAELFGDELAKIVQLSMEYDPAPPFRAGTPESPDTDPAVVERLQKELDLINVDTWAAIGRSRQALV